MEFASNPHEGRSLRLHRLPWRFAGLGAAFFGGITAGCTGTAFDFQPRFDSINAGATRKEVMAIVGEPLVTETWDVAGMTVIRSEYADSRSRYSVVMVGTPVTEPRVLAKGRIPYFNYR